MFKSSILGLALCCANCLDRQEQTTSPVRAGMSANEVRQLIGTPLCVSRQLLYRRHIEQWVYENPHPLRVQMNCVRGEEPVVTAVLRSRTYVTTGK
jgi:hypothetical protein